MKPVLIQPSDTFFFRDSIPMSAGQGRGAGARLPLPSTLHEAFRASLFEKYGRSDERAAFRPKGAPRSGGWLGKGRSTESTGSKDFQSLQLIGPLPYLEPHEEHPGGLHFPLPLDLVWDEDGKAHTLSLLEHPGPHRSSPLPLLAVSPAPASKDQPAGFLSAKRIADYLAGNLDGLAKAIPERGKQPEFPVLKAKALFEPEYRIGVALDPGTNIALEGQLFAATHARPDEHFRLAAWVGLKNPANDEQSKLDQLDFLLLGGERRIARLWAAEATALPVPAPPTLPPGNDGPTLLKWTLVTPAVFAHGSMPGWCVDTGSQGRPRGEVCLPLEGGRARLVATCQGKLLAFSGWDTLKHEAKPTQLAVPPGSVFYFLCENGDTATALAAKLHWQPRSDHYGEKGCGYGLVSFDAKLHPTSPDICTFASEIFTA